MFGGTGANRTVDLFPLANANGMVTVTLVVSDGLRSGTDTFVVTWTPDDDPPDARDDSYVAYAGQSLVVTADSGLLANDREPDGDDQLSFRRTSLTCCGAGIQPD